MFWPGCWGWRWRPPWRCRDQHLIYQVSSLWPAAAGPGSGAGQLISRSRSPHNENRYFDCRDNSFILHLSQRATDQDSGSSQRRLAQVSLIVSFRKRWKWCLDQCMCLCGAVDVCAICRKIFTVNTQIKNILPILSKISHFPFHFRFL